MGEKPSKIDHIPPQFSQPTPIYPRSFPARGHKPRTPGQKLRKKIRSARAWITQKPRTTQTSPKTNAKQEVSRKEAMRTLFATYLATCPGNVPRHMQKGRSTKCESASHLTNPTEPARPTGLADLTAVMRLQKTTQPRRCSSSRRCCRRAQPDRWCRTQ